MQFMSVEDVKDTCLLTPKTKKISKLKIKPFFVEKKVNPFDTVEWILRSACIKNNKNQIIFEQDRIEVPICWSQSALNIVSSKYFYGVLGSSERETSVRQLIRRVVDTITEWGCQQSYFETFEDSVTFKKELTYILLHQMASFNSPVWFNVGVVDKPQCSACFINSVDDNMKSILELVVTEGLIFQKGSGTGTNLSNIRSKKEGLSSGGNASGPVSFMKGYDVFAGIIKSGGGTRRAAKMAILNVDHPDIIEFIRCKVKEERKAWDLIDIGYEKSIDGDAYASVFFQNANNSVRVTDDFMNAVVNNESWTTYARTTGKPLAKYEARNIFNAIVKSVWQCGDPGIQFDTVVNAWHTCSNSGKINASNPCGEFVFLDNSACNLASMNLLKFLNKDNEFNVESFKQVVDIMIIAQDIMVDKAEYPTPEIKKSARKFRPLGLGYANLGALLMTKGFPYDSDVGRAYASVITSLMTGEAYRQSAVLAEKKGPFIEYENNSEPMMEIIQKHITFWEKIISNDFINTNEDCMNIANNATSAWFGARWIGAQNGFRNAQATLLAPTGTIAFMMDCATTGIEPDMALIKQKNFVGGGVLRIVNQIVSESLKNLGYSSSQVKTIIDYIDKNETIEGAPELLEKDLPVFDCAINSSGGTRFIAPKGHTKMMAAVQPFISGAISKTVNMPADATEEDIKRVFINSWNLGLKSVAIYREGSKKIQPLIMNQDYKKNNIQRRKLPNERPSITHKFMISGHEGCITVGMYPDGNPGEIFIRMAKMGSTVSGLMSSLALAVSMSLQYGVPLEVLVEKYINSSFEPSGFTSNNDITFAKSFVDYVFRWLSIKFLKTDINKIKNISKESFKKIASDDSSICTKCGSLMTRSGNCHTCINCGATGGCG
jgi:ribonucleoside-diphosphate reductase alpha chain